MGGAKSLARTAPLRGRAARAGLRALDGTDSGGHREVIITERIEDMFVVGGFNRPRTEIERLVAAHPLIGPAAWVGMHAPDKMLAHASVFTLSRYAG
ncbi:MULTISPECIES: hypothetical protein [Burkholderia cepacia complex]|uniref:hypothetical protein n=1 Tax=Burkholderia cepacia complex TaxID=87882 RepID=UPI001B8F2F0D|nr:hypothetical protein [Burkholderia cenocepacia]MBR8323121.1 hypothetical protein [Burkholderia cenocepacia]